MTQKKRPLCGFAIEVFDGEVRIRPGRASESDPPGPLHVHGDADWEQKANRYAARLLYPDFEEELEFSDVWRRTEGNTFIYRSSVPDWRKV